MLRVVGLLLLCAGTGVLLCQLDTLALESSHEPPATTWVRTVDGWEIRERWHRVQPDRTRLSPFVLAGLQTLGALLALLAFAPNSDAARSPNGSHSVLQPSARK